MKDQVTAVHTDDLEKPHTLTLNCLFWIKKVISQTHNKEIDILYLSPELLLSSSIEILLVNGS